MWFVPIASMRSAADNVPVHAPLYASPVLYECPGFKMLSVICETQEDKLRRLLAFSPFEYVVDRFIAYVADLQNCTLGPFYDSGIIVPARFGKVLGGYVAYEFVTSDVAMAAGREPWGYPKKLAGVKMTKRGSRLHGTVIRNGKLLIELSCELTSKQIDIPDTPSNPSLLYNVIPRPDGPGALIRRVISRAVTPFDIDQGTKQYGRANVRLKGSKEDPVHELKPTKVFGAIYSTGYYKSAWGKVLATLEKNL